MEMTAKIQYTILPAEAQARVLKNFCDSLRTKQTVYQATRDLDFFIRGELFSADIPPYTVLSYSNVEENERVIMRLMADLIERAMLTAPDHK
jgi:hypothetical protein